MSPKIKQLESFRDFKQKLKLFLLGHPFYWLNALKMAIISNTSKTRRK